MIYPLPRSRPESFFVSFFFFFLALFLVESKDFIRSKVDIGFKSSEMT